VCCGPLAERIHGVDERVHLPSVTTTAQVLALLVRDWCGVTA
jgi:acetylornithine deacetylase